MFLSIVTSVAPILTGGGRSAGPIDPVDSPDKHRQELAHAADLHSERGVKAEYAPAIGEPADKDRCELAVNEDADLIVVGTREPGVIRRLYFVWASVRRWRANRDATS